MVNLGILGCSNVARKNSIPAFLQLKNADVKWIASRDKEKAKEWAREFSIPSFGTYDELVNSSEIDAVYISLPTGLHEEWAIKAANVGKHVICEKSLAHSYEAVLRMVSACKKNKVVLFENFMCAYHPQHDKIKQTIKDGKIGESVAFSGYFGFPPLNKDKFIYNKKLGGGSLNEVGTYPVFMSGFIFDEAPLAVTCFLEVDKINGVDIRGSAFIEFAKRKIGFASFGFDNVYQNNYSIWGNKGLLKVERAYSIPEDLKPNIILLKNENLKESIELLNVPPKNQFASIFDDFCETIINRNDAKRNIKYEEIILQARTMEALRLSAKENRKVFLNEV
jgi:dTDP-3,4-didehydro-2,6-dideoxy-alpha-D-glucose 3-reductase